MQDFEQQNGQIHWREALDRLSAIREQEDYSTENVDFIQTQLRSPDERVRAGAALTAAGCLFERYILDLVIELAESDPNPGVRKAAIQSLGGVIYEGVMQDFEDDSGADTGMEYFEEWDELQSEGLQDDYRRVKNLLFSILLNELEDQDIREAALLSVSDIGFLQPVREWIADFSESERQSSLLVAIHAMGKYPDFWIERLAQFLSPQNEKPILMEAVSSSYSSRSAELAQHIETLLEKEDPDILEYALLTLANINRTENLGAILQRYTLHPEEKVSKAARQGIEQISGENFRDYMENELGLEE